MKKAHQILIVVGIFYAVYILLFLAKFDFNPSATIELSRNYIHEYNGTLPPGLVVQVNREGHDGQQYYMRLLDIFRGEMSVALVLHQRILYPTLAYLLSFGNITLIPWILLLINFFSVIFGTYIFILILGHYKSDLNMAYLFCKKKRKI